jgi:2-oxoglutarate dehydrogenase E2 component (dihydrolipoamide succinyltransferase)
MAIEIKAPQFPESVADGSIATWHKQPGEPVSRDELLVDIETDKVVLEVVAPADGAISEILKGEGDIVLSSELIALFEAGDVAADNSAQASGEEASSSAVDLRGEKQKLNPAARKLAEESGIDPASIPGSGKDGRVTKEDVLNAIKNRPLESEKKPDSKTDNKAVQTPSPAASSAADILSEAMSSGRVEKRVPMTRLRARVAERLLNASRSTAMLTTFNEVNMQPVMELRQKYKDLFEKTHNGTRLGFMSFFVRAAVDALKRFPAVNASIDGSDIVYHGYQDIGVAVSSERGLVVPVLRNADNMGLADIEDKIREFGAKARDGKLSIEDIQGGTFTITNGGVFGSLMSTPILNPPQTGILGMHKIQERPMAVDGEVRILPMMYLALSYDHRLIDGKDAVQFLIAIKNLLEDPARILLEI